MTAHHRSNGRRAAGIAIGLAAAFAALFLAVSCGGGGWKHVVVPTDTSSSSDCVSSCLKKSGPARYKCYTKCPGSRVAKAESCDGAMAALRKDGWSYGGGYQCESSK